MKIKSKNDNIILLAVGDKNGMQFCDVKCYDAQEPICDCVCSGRNHGIGLQKAIKSSVTQEKLFRKMWGKKLTLGEVVMAKIMSFAD